MNFDALKNMLMQRWQAMQSARQQQAQNVANWQQNTAALAPILQQRQQMAPRPPGPQSTIAVPQIGSMLQNLNIPSAGAINAQAQSYMNPFYQKIMSMIGR